MADLNLKCIDCKEEFIFTEGEQTFFKQKGLVAPKRCSDCRRKRKEQVKDRGWDNNSGREQ